MNPSKSIVDGRSRRTSRSSLRFESLERRLPLAGNVVAELVGSTLRLTGDNQANDVMVASAADGKIAVIGVNTTINGGAGAFVSNKAVASIVANFNGGDDSAGFGNSAVEYAFQRLFTLLATSPTTWSGEEEPPAPFDVAALQARIDAVAGGVTTLSIPGSLTVTTGDGNDSLGISGTLAGSVIVNLGSADIGNGLVIGSEVSASRVGGRVNVKGGDLNDLFVIGNVAVGGAVSAALGDGVNWMVVGGEAATPATIGALAYTGGVNMDTVSLYGNVTVRNDVSIFTGSQGEDSVGFETSDTGDAVNVFGNVVVNTGTGGGGDDVDVVGHIRGTVTVTTGSGRDTVSVSSSVGWISSDGGDPVPTFETTGPTAIGLELNISTGAGKDLISIGTSTVGRNATIDAGSGADFVRIDGVQVGRNLFVGLGEGDDSLQIANLRAFAAFLAGGSGANVLSLDATTPAAVRKLWLNQLQVVATG